MRAFVAVDLAQATRKAVEGFVTGLRRYPVFEEIKVDWVKAVNLHVTLRFLGDIEPAQADSVISALVEPWSLAPFDLAFDKCEVFPHRGTPRAIYLAAEEGSDRLMALQAEVVQRLARFGFAMELRRFRPHMTIGRVRRVTQLVANRIPDVLGAATVDVPASPIGQLVLYESRPLPTGPFYDAVIRVPIGVQAGGRAERNWPTGRSSHQ